MPQYQVIVQSRRVIRFTAVVEVDAPNPDTARRLATEKALGDPAEPDWAAGEEVERTHWAGPEDVHEAH